MVGEEGLDGKGFYVKPTVCGRVKSDSRLAQEEVFGPVLSIITYTDEADAVRTGMVDINGGGFNMQAPFGGY
ncbi:MAG: aldehyde dehydrogenase family protein [Rhizobacter sp.]|nr:aldehyde dehydrogenase family protein [Rhizobacter sp.]